MGRGLLASVLWEWGRGGERKRKKGEWARLGWDIGFRSIGDSETGGQNRAVCVEQGYGVGGMFTVGGAGEELAARLEGHARPPRFLPLRRHPRLRLRRRLRKEGCDA